MRPRRRHIKPALGHLPLGEIHRSYVLVSGRAIDEGTETHRMRRIALDPDTVELPQPAAAWAKSWH